MISFDETFNWVVDMGPATGLDEKSALINQITANGGAKIYQAVQAAYDNIVNQEASRKHIILLTDGVSTPGTQEDFPQLEKDALAKHVTISTVGVGDYINRELLDELAKRRMASPIYVQDPAVNPRRLSTAKSAALEDLAIQEHPCAQYASTMEVIDGIDFTEGARPCAASSRRRPRKAPKPSCAWMKRSPFWCAGAMAWAHNRVYVRCQSTVRSAMDWSGIVRHSVATNGPQHCSS